MLTGRSDTERYNCLAAAVAIVGRTCGIAPDGMKSLSLGSLHAPSGVGRSLQLNRWPAAKGHPGAIERVRSKVLTKPSWGRCRRCEATEPKSFHRRPSKFP